MAKEPVFVEGQVVEATGGYNWLLTKGKRYVVLKYERSVRCETFTWPAYVTVMGDHGKPVTGHTYRFRAVDDAQSIAQKD